MKLILPLLSVGLAASLALVSCQTETADTTPSTDTTTPAGAGQANAKVVSLNITGMT